jgi:hypothetical protein
MLAVSQSVTGDKRRGYDPFVLREIVRHHGLPFQPPKARRRTSKKSYGKGY